MNWRRPELQRLALGVHRRIGKAFPPGLRARVRDFLFPVDKRPVRELLIDVVGGCNLRCPSCPVGNMGNINPTGLLDEELLRQIVQKANRDYHITFVGLFNWAEPMLHPELPELISIVRKEGLRCALSSNLNVVRRVDEVFAAEPNLLRISLSGFTQETYGRTHERGKIDKVKANMRLLAESKRRVGNQVTDVQVYFHKYRDNLHEVEPMRQYAAELGFSWMENWAFYMPLEKLFDLSDGTLPAAERSFVEETFALPIVEAITAAHEVRERPCPLLERQIVLDLQGQLILCCAVYDFAKNGHLGTFLDMTPDDLVRAKQRHSTCDTCMTKGLHMYSNYYEYPDLAAKYDELVQINLRRAPTPAVRSLPII